MFAGPQQLFFMNRLYEVFFHTVISNGVQPISKRFKVCQFFRPLKFNPYQAIKQAHKKTLKLISLRVLEPTFKSLPQQLKVNAKVINKPGLHTINYRTNLSYSLLINSLS